MPGRRVVRVVGLVSIALGLTAWAFGGWAVITVDDFPETVTVTQPTTLSFMVRQHGVTPLERLSPRVTATDGKSEIDVPVSAEMVPGRYSSKLVLPKAGDWSITVRSGFVTSDIKLPPVRAVARGAASPPARLPADRGQRLFVAKGCVTCHVHDAVSALGYKSLEVGPELTPKRYEPAYLRRFLTDPSIARTPGRPEMPKLGLSNAELTALVAFINADRSVAAQR